MSSTNFYLNNPWKPVSHSYITDAVLRKQIDTDGYAVLNVLPKQDTDALIALYNETHNIENGIGGMFDSIFSVDLEYRRKMHDEIGRILKPYMDSMLTDYKTVLNSYVVKASGPKSEFYVHQDPTYLDEFQYSPLSFWIPLVDMTPHNGALCVMPGTHKFFSPYRGMSFAAPFDSLHAEIKKYLIPLYPKVGEIVVFDNRILHNSMPNLSGKERVVIVSGVFPKQAVMQTCWKDSAKPDTIEVFEHEEDHLLTYNKFLDDCWTRPDVGRSIKFVKEIYPEVTLENFTELCKASGIAPVNILQPVKGLDNHMIKEPHTKIDAVAVQHIESGTEAVATPSTIQKPDLLSRIKAFFN